MKRTMMKIYDKNFTPDADTMSFAWKYLKPGAREEGLSFVGMRNEMKNVDRDIVEEFILDMNYKEFMQTSYWRLVSWQVKVNAGWACSNCGSKRRLVAHHLDYSIFGREAFHLDKLQCLCQRCHERIHRDDK